MVSHMKDQMDLWVNFHDASLTKILHEGGNLILHIEDATIGSSDKSSEWQNQDGTLHLFNIQEIRIDGVPATELTLLSLDNTILSLHFREGWVEAFIQWSLPAAPYGEAYHEYKIACTEMKWQPNP